VLTQVLTLALLLAPSDWPHLRGHGYDGVSQETNLADTWPAEGPPRLWARDLGQGHSGVIVAEGRLYTQRQTLSGQFVLCLDPQTGQTVWETRIDWPWQPHGGYPGPYATPTYSGGKIYFATPAGLVGCLDARTGAEVWSFNLREKFQGKGFGFGYAATPLVEDGRVILPAGGPDAGLVALDGADGRTLWTAGSDPASYCPAYPITIAGRRCVVGYLQNALVLVELATGNMLHRQPLSTGYDEHSAWPLYREPHLLLTAPFRAPAVRLELRPEPDAVSVVPKWSSAGFANDVVSSVLVGEHVYGFALRDLQSTKHRPSRGSFQCLDWATGKVTWTTDQVGHAAILAADGKLFLLNDTGTLILVRADPARYQELDRIPLFEDETCWTPPTLWHGRLFVRSPSQLVCLWVGREEDAPGTRLLPPNPRSWRIDATWLLTRERDYPNDAPTLEEMTTWFLACVAILLGAFPVRFLKRPWLSWLLVFILGLLGPNLLSTLCDRLLFTWPVSLYAAFHLALIACRWAIQNPGRRGAGWLARLALVGLILIGYGYVELCRTVGMFIAWAFLIGFPVALPLTWLAVRAEMNSRPWRMLTWTLLAFAAYFWSAHGLLLWKASQGT
jgi:outer membrane protein assembly factor BamB